MSKKAQLGEALRALRQQNGWSLSEVSRRTGIAVSTLSKVENDRLSLTYDKLQGLSEGLGVDIAYFFSTASHKPTPALTPTGRRAVDRREDGRIVETPNYQYRFLSAELTRKKFVPVIVEHHARRMEEFGDFVRHAGEEFLYVLEGRLEVRTEYYEPLILEAGDSIYIDSMMGHAYLAIGDGVCRTLGICSAPEAQIEEAVERAKGATEEQPLHLVPKKAVSKRN